MDSTNAHCVEFYLELKVRNTWAMTEYCLNLCRDWYWAERSNYYRWWRYQSAELKEKEIDILDETLSEDFLIKWGRVIGIVAASIITLSSIAGIVMYQSHKKKLIMLYG